MQSRLYFWLRTMPIIPLLTGAMAPSVVLATPSDSGEARWCRVCHMDTKFGTTGIGKSVHKDLSCQDCHAGYQFNPHEKVEQASADGLDKALAKRSRSPVALAACSDCHSDEVEALAGSKHGAARSKENVRAPYCLDCHGDPHRITASSEVSEAERRREMNERCAACHANPELMGTNGPKTDVIETYEHSTHARKLDLGSNRTPGCADCHGGHVQTDMRADRVKVCGKCHTGANEAFAGSFGHLTIDKDTQPLAYYTQKFFAWLTFTTIFLLSLHVLLDLLATIRIRLFRNKHNAGR